MKECFNSLQTGKTFQTGCRHTRRIRYLWVSIPFKRERLSKQYILGSQSRTQCSSFNSLQTGKTFRTRAVMEDLKTSYCMCQFPSNGMGFLNKRFTRTRTSICSIGSFNSLQTGWAFRTTLLRANLATADNVSIPFKRDRLSEPVRNRRVNYSSWFQFPSNGIGFPNYCHGT